jgi:hypothetical protein
VCVIIIHYCIYLFCYDLAKYVASKYYEIYYVIRKLKLVRRDCRSCVPGSITGRGQITSTQFYL